MQQVLLVVVAFVSLLAVATAAPPLPQLSAVIGNEAAETAVAVNEKITQAYIDIARIFQNEVVGGYDSRTRAALHRRPMWFAFAPPASSEVGKGQRAASLALAGFTGAGSSNYHQRVCNELKSSGRVSYAAAVLVCNAMDIARPELLQDGFAFATQMALAASHGMTAGESSAIFSVDVLSALASRGYEALKAQPSSHPLDKVQDMLRELIQGLKEGNVAIFRDVGGSTIRFLEWFRAGGSGQQQGQQQQQQSSSSRRPTWQEVIAAAPTLFPAAGKDKAVRSADVQALWDKLHGIRKEDANASADENANDEPEGERSVLDRVIDTFSGLRARAGRAIRKVFSGRMGVSGTFYKRAPFSSFAAGSGRTNTYMALAFALYTKAGSADSKLSNSDRDWMIEWGNVLLAYREQRIAVHPTFVAHERVFSPMTPFIQLGKGRARWSLVSYVRNLPRKPRTGWQIRGHKTSITEFNWAKFDDVGSVLGRWKPILNAFEVGYKSLADVWRFPNPDPNLANF